MRYAEHDRRIDEELTCRKFAVLDDWYVIERQDHDGRYWTEQREDGASVLCCSSRITDADIEGNCNAMARIADAIDNNGKFSAPRCAVDATGSHVFLMSPRNSTYAAIVPKDKAAALAARIRQIIDGPSA